MKQGDALRPQPEIDKKLMRVAEKETKILNKIQNDKAEQRRKNSQRG